MAHESEHRQDSGDPMAPTAKNPIFHLSLLLSASWLFYAIPDNPWLKIFCSGWVYPCQGKDALCASTDFQIIGNPLTKPWACPRIDLCRRPRLETKRHIENCRARVSCALAKEAVFPKLRFWKNGFCRAPPVAKNWHIEFWPLMWPMFKSVLSRASHHQHFIPENCASVFSAWHEMICHMA